MRSTSRALHAYASCPFGFFSPFSIIRLVGLLFHGRSSSNIIIIISSHISRVSFTFAPLRFACLSPHFYRHHWHRPPARRFLVPISMYSITDPFLNPASRHIRLSIAIYTVSHPPSIKFYSSASLVFSVNISIGFIPWLSPSYCPLLFPLLSLGPSAAALPPLIPLIVYQAYT